MNRVPQGPGSIRVGVVGLGYFGTHHARHYAASRAAELVAVVDADEPRALAAGLRHGVDGLTDHRELIGRVDAVSIAAPTSLHHVIAAELIDAGIDVFVEKPVAATVVDAADLVARAAKADVVLQVGHIERFAPAFQSLAKQVRALRSIACVRHTPWRGRAADVDVVLDLMIHDIDLVLALARAPVIAIEAAGTPVVTGDNDVVGARLTFDNGVVASLSASRVAAEAERTLTVAETGRQLKADLSRQTLTVTPSSGEARTHEFGASDNLAAEIAAFLHSVATGSRPMVDGRAGLDALKVAEMVRAAIAAERTRTGVMDG
jgi:predicted dehydrogenase